ncbi:hypothetical protein AFCDBAGC_3487 [Methylobacterium cerastii]|uniref:Tc1-like transposase DDE domain-containing protein n=1 Tax=Methylobacterium cerastii TaxID=932741 RepID=A0ABQ4QK35_9HYPH|nr:hypothetical protein AFCDBAGC_3487 [Methylobacterium cerastii]
MKAAREAWFEGQLDLDPDALVFLDETAANTSMARRYGRAPRGERCRVAAPIGHWKTTTVTAAGARPLYLPPYSPDLNPIEMAFAKLKATL